MLLRGAEHPLYAKKMGQVPCLFSYLRTRRITYKMDNSVVVSLRDIVVEFDGQRILDGLNLDIHDKEFVTLLGPSGCGKTTLLRILTGLEAPDCGEITGVPARIAMVFQEDRLVDSLTVRANLRLALGAGYDPADAQALLNELDLPDALRRTVGALSGGMKRRVALARALLYDAPLLVLDEPFKGLDETTARQCMDALARRAAGRAVLLVTHDAQEGDYLHARTLQMEKLQRV